MGADRRRAGVSGTVAVRLVALDAEAHGEGERNAPPRAWLPSLRRYCRDAAAGVQRGGEHLRRVPAVRDRVWISPQMGERLPRHRHETGDRRLVQRRQQLVAGHLLRSPVGVLERGGLDHRVVGRERPQWVQWWWRRWGGRRWWRRRWRQLVRWTPETRKVSLALRRRMLPRLRSEV